MMVRNVHERVLPVPADEVGPLLDRLGGPEDVLWPSPQWAPMVLDRPVGLDATGGHGPVRYRVTAHRPGRLVEFTARPGSGFDGTHTFSVEPADASRTVLRHVLRARPIGGMRLLWPLVVRWVHDAVLEDLFDRAEAAVGTGPARPARWSPLGAAAPQARRSAGPPDRGAGHRPAGHRPAAGRLVGRADRRLPPRRTHRPPGLGGRGVPRSAPMGRRAAGRAGVPGRAGRHRTRGPVVLRHGRAGTRRGAARHGRAPSRLPGVGPPPARPCGPQHGRPAAQCPRPRLLPAGAGGAPGDRAGHARPRRPPAVGPRPAARAAEATAGARNERHFRPTGSDERTARSGRDASDGEQRGRLSQRVGDQRGDRAACPSRRCRPRRRRCGRSR